MKSKRRHCPYLLTLCCLILVALALSLIAFIPISLALKPGEVSYAAEIGAGMRAVAAMEPDEKIRNPDYMAAKFLIPNFWLFGPLRKDFNKTQEFIKFYRVSRYYMANALTWHVDGVMQQAAANNLKQVVIIGAGFDSRPYRFAKQMAHVRFFEVDLPATQARKKEMLIKEFEQLPAHVTYIPLDYRSQRFFKKLAQSGYEKKHKTLFLWEASIMFADREVVEHTLQSIAQNSAPDSEILFAYIFDELVQGDFSRYMGAWYGSVRMTAAGEPWRFGIAEGKAERFMTQRGFRVISDLGSQELAQQYLVRSDGSIDGKPTAFVRVMHAMVKP
jgi:methyltransferase (TIGR00027 family)